MTPNPPENSAGGTAAAPSGNDGAPTSMGVIPRVVEEEMKSSYLDYAMSVIVGRALPDVRDGLKPVHRRILYAMHEMGMLHNKPFKKSARIVGEVLGKYHPHGDTAVYDALVRLAQEFSMRSPLINGQGNFGSVDGDNAAAMRYTECKLSKISEELLGDIEKETVSFVPNFDASLKEPSVLPSKIPNLLINGSSGIAVGMATNIPPHNAGEIIDGTVSLIDNPECSTDDLFTYVKGPDFPTAAIISGTNEIHRAYLTGQGKVQVKAKTDIEPNKDRERIIVTEIPYQVNKASLLEEIAELVRDKKITGISDLRDESDRDGMRIVIELKKDANPTVVLNQLYTYTRMTQTFGMNMLALVDNEPKLLSLKELLQHFISHRQVVVRKRTEFDLKKAEEKSHLLEGLIIALNNIDAVIQKIKKSATVEAAKVMLMNDYDLSELQAKAILDMRLQKLSSLEQEKIREEQKQLLLLIKELKEVLASEQRILGIIKQELLELKQQYGDARKTIIEHTDGEEDLVIEDLIKEEPMVVTISRSGYIKRLPLTTYRQQGRGGTGVKGAGTKEDDVIERLFVASTHSYILFFTNKGRVYWQKVYQIPEAGRQAKGRAIVNFIQLSPGELVQAVVPVKEFNSSHYLFLATRKGTVKKTELEAYSRPRQGGIIAVTLDEGDELVNACITTGNDQIILATKHGMAVRFHEENVRPMGRGATGVRGITLKGDDVVIAMVIADDKQDLLTVTEHGYGKRTLVSEYRLINRGGSGVINIQCTERNGNVVSVCSVTEEDDLMLISKDGILIRMACKGVSQIGRNTQGVRLMRLREEDTVIATTRVISEQQDIV